MTSGARDFRRVQERHYSAHHTLLRVARFELAKAERKEVGWFDSTFVALTFSALAIEALSNAIGDRIVPDWKDFETAAHLRKFGCWLSDSAFLTRQKTTRGEPFAG